MKRFIALLLAMVMCLSLFAGCAKEEKNEELVKAKEYLYSLYVNASTETATDLEYPARVKGGNTFFDVEWTVEILSGKGEIKVVPSQNEGFVVVDVPAEAAEDILYKLTATIKTADGKQTETLTYEYKVPKFTLTTYEEYAAAENGTLIVAQGVVTAILSKTNGDSSNSLYFQNEGGAFYAYNLATDPIADGIEIGMTVRVTGAKDLYNGTYEIINCTAEIIDTNKTILAPADYTEIYQNAADLKDASLTTLQALLVTIKGVEITKQEDKYLKFKLGDKETYIYISSSNCPGTAEEEAQMVATYNEKGGNIANVTGLITLYNGSFYLTPVGPDAFEYLGLPEKNDTEKVEFESGNLVFPSIVDKDTEFDLPAVGQSYTDVTINWNVEGDAAIVDGKLVLTMPKANATIKLTATITCGEVTKELSYVIMLMVTAPSYEEIVNMAYSLAPGAAMDVKFQLQGVITSVDTPWNEQYGNITVTIQVGDLSDKLIQCFRLKGDGAADLQVGDTITVEGILKNYNGKIEFDAGCVLVAGGNENNGGENNGNENNGNENNGNENNTTQDTDGMQLTIKEAIERANKAGDTPTSIKYKLTGKVIEIKNDTYGNLVIQDSTGTILIYGCYSADGSTRYDAMDNYPQVGDTITVYGVLMSYKGETPQMKNAWCISGGTGDRDNGGNEGGNEGGNDQPTVDTDGMQLTIAEAIERAKAAGSEGTTIKYKVTGKVTEVQNEIYGNFVIQDSTGSLLIYGCFSADGSTRYDAMDNYPQVGDTVTLYGMLVLYTNAEGVETPEMKNAWCISGGTGKHQPSGETAAKPIDGAPQVGVAYKFGMVQQNVSTSQVYYLAGGMNGYYMATTTDVSEAIDIYLEQAEGGYYMYTIDARGDKQYINMVVSGTHVNGAYQATASTVYTWDAESKTMVATVNDDLYWFGTRNDKSYTTVGPCKISYEGFYCMFYTP